MGTAKNSYCIVTSWRRYLEKCPSGLPQKEVTGATSPGEKQRHWKHADFGIINQLGDKEITISNCKGFSEDGKPLMLKRTR